MLLHNFYVTALSHLEQLSGLQRVACHGGYHIVEAFIYSLLYSPSAFTSFSHCVHKCWQVLCRLTEMYNRDSVSCKHPLSTHSRVSYRILSWGGEGRKPGWWQDDSSVRNACMSTRGVWGHAPPPQENFEFIYLSDCF